MAGQGRILFHWADGTEYRAYVRRYDNQGNRIDGQPDTRDMRLPSPQWQAGCRGMRETDETGSLHRLPLRVRDRLALQAPVRARQDRRQTMQAARQAEAVRRQAVRDETEAACYWQPTGALLGALRDYVADGRTWRHQAEAVQTEAEAGALAGRQWKWLTASDPDGSRPALAVRAPGAVNGQEARGSRRWQGTGREALQDWQGYRLQADETGKRQWQAVQPIGLDPWQCYRVKADGTREAFSAPVKAGKASGKAGTRAASRKAGRGTGKYLQPQTAADYLAAAD